METIAAEVARSREQNRTRAEAQSHSDTEQRRGASIALLSINVDPAVQQLAERLEAGARAAGARMLRRTMQSPDVVHPLAVQAAIDAFTPDTCWLIGVTPAEVPFRLPNSSTAIFIPHDNLLDALWLEHVPVDAIVAFNTQQQFEQAVTAGRDAKNTLLFHPAALPGLATAGRAQFDDPAPPRVLVLANGPDPSPEAVGLHLASHCHLWREATAILRERVATYVDDDAESLIAAAEAKMGIQLQSDDVRRGLADRIRWVLGPAIVGQEYCRALLAEGINFDLVGIGWAFDPDLMKCRVRPAWPSPDDVGAFLSQYQVCVSLDTSKRITCELMDAMAAGLLCMSQRGKLDDPQGWVEVSALPSDKAQGPTQFARQAKQTLAESTMRDRRTLELAALINERHTWANRVTEVLATSITQSAAAAATRDA